MVIIISIVQGIVFIIIYSKVCKSQENAQKEYFLQNVFIFLVTLGAMVSAPFSIASIE
jgi:phosphotransferase system  glucose/maltose/N-acetylglucosamine-specific IIC component